MVNVEDFWKIVVLVILVILPLDVEIIPWLIVVVNLVVPLQIVQIVEMDVYIVQMEYVQKTNLYVEKYVVDLDNVQQVHHALNV